jgi:hypothetical protein
MIGRDGYDVLFQHADGHLRAPFSHLGFYLRGASPSAAERRANRKCHSVPREPSNLRRATSGLSEDVSPRLMGRCPIL